MTADLEHLLRQADEAIAPPPPRAAGTLSQAVGYRVRRRRRWRRVSVTAVLTLLMLASLGLWVRVKPVKPMDNPPVALVPPRPDDAPKVLEGQDLQAQMAAWDQEISQHQALVNRLKRLEAQQKLQTALAQAQAADPLPKMDEQAERAALILFTQGQRYQDEMNLKPAAVQAFRQAASLFPETQWGRSAQARLATLGG